LRSDAENASLRVAAAQHPVNPPPTMAMRKVASSVFGVMRGGARRFGVGGREDNRKIRRDDY
jgi:hypothetical protein